MPAWRPVRSDRPTRPVPPALLLGTETVTVTALPSNVARAMAASRHGRPGWPERRERTVAGGWSQTGKGTPCNRVPPFVRWRSRAGGLRVPCHRLLPFLAGQGPRQAGDGRRAVCERRRDKARPLSLVGAEFQASASESRVGRRPSEKRSPVMEPCTSWRRRSRASTWCHLAAPLQPRPRSGHRPLWTIRRSQRNDPALPGVRVTLAAVKVTLVGPGVT